MDRYDDACVPSTNQKVGFIKDPATNKTCIRSFTVSYTISHSSPLLCRISRFLPHLSYASRHRTLQVPKKMRKPIYVYYQLDNFYQNHRRFVESHTHTYMDKAFLRVEKGVNFLADFAVKVCEK